MLFNDGGIIMQILWFIKVQIYYWHVKGLCILRKISDRYKYYKSTIQTLITVSFFPDDHSRVILTQIDGVQSSDYINASYIDVS